MSEIDPEKSHLFSLKCTARMKKHTFLSSERLLTMEPWSLGPKFIQPYIVHMHTTHKKYLMKAIIYGPERNLPGPGTPQHFWRLIYWFELKHWTIMGHIIKRKMLCAHNRVHKHVHNDIHIICHVIMCKFFVHNYVHLALL